MWTKTAVWLGLVSAAVILGNVLGLSEAVTVGFGTGVSYVLAPWATVKGKR
jgi:hypothetical protein